MRICPLTAHLLVFIAAVAAVLCSITRQFKVDTPAAILAGEFFFCTFNAWCCREDNDGLLKIYKSSFLYNFSAKDLVRNLISEYLNTRPLVHDKEILLPDKLICKILARIDKLKFYKKYQKYCNIFSYMINLEVLL